MGNSRNGQTGDKKSLAETRYACQDLAGENASEPNLLRHDEAILEELAFVQRAAKLLLDLNIVQIHVRRGFNIVLSDGLKNRGTGP